jgi:membrane protein implicated in regulation of membrane protease activity
MQVYQIRRNESMPWDIYSLPSLVVALKAGGVYCNGLNGATLTVKACDVYYLLAWAPKLDLMAFLVISFPLWYPLWS